MKKTSVWFCLLALASLQLACNLTVATPTPTPLPPTATATSLPPTETPIPGSPVMVSQISMVDAQNGWGWLANPDYTFRLLRTTDGGQNWQDVSPQAGNFNPTSSFFLDAQTAWVSTFDATTNAAGLLHTEDGGKTWSVLTKNALVQAFYTFDDAQHGRAEQAEGGAGSAFYTLFTTTDGGATWTPFTIKPPTGVDVNDAGVIRICNICGDSLYWDATRLVITHGDLASDPGGTVRFSMSIDQGQTWKDLELPLPSEQYKGGLVAPGSPKFFGAKDGVLPVSISKFKADGSQDYAVVALYITHDNGQTWAPSAAVAQNSNAYAEQVILSPQEVFIACGGKLCATHDGGATWQTLAIPAPPDSGAKFDFVSPKIGWLTVPDANNNTTLFQTQNGGVSWTKLNPLLLPWSVKLPLPAGKP